MKWPIPRARQERREIAAKLFYSMSPTHKSAQAVNTVSGRWHPNISSFVHSVSVLVFSIIFCVRFFAENLGYGYISGKCYKTTAKNLSSSSSSPLLLLSYLFLFQLVRKKKFLNTSYSPRKLHENILPLFSIVLLFSSPLLNIKLLLPEM